MSFFHIIAAFAVVSSLAEAQEISRNPLRFKDIQSVKEWAKSGIGGSEVKILSHNNNLILFVDRMLTSGVVSSKVTIFSKKDNFWTNALELHQYWNDCIICQQIGDTVILSLKSSKHEILRFSISALCARETP